MFIKEKPDRKKEECFEPVFPTCCKEGLQLTCCISSNKWSSNSLDVKTIFLQRRLTEWTIYVNPPKEVQTNKVCKLRKCIYRLAMQGDSNI